MSGPNGLDRHVRSPPEKLSSNWGMQRSLLRVIMSATVAFTTAAPFVSIGSVHAGGQREAMVRPSASQWLEDLEALRTIIMTRHANPFAHVSRDAFEQRVAALRQELPQLPRDSDRAVRLAALAAMIGDGHTNLQVYDALPRLPLRWFWFGDELRITATAPAEQHFLGARVVSIAGHPIAEATARVRGLRTPVRVGVVPSELDPVPASVARCAARLRSSDRWSPGQPGPPDARRPRGVRRDEGRRGRGRRRSKETSGSCRILLSGLSLSVKPTQFTFLMSRRCWKNGIFVRPWPLSTMNKFVKLPML